MLHTNTTHTEIHMKLIIKDDHNNALLRCHIRSWRNVGALLQMVHKDGTEENIVRARVIYSEEDNA